MVRHMARNADTKTEACLLFRTAGRCGCSGRPGSDSASGSAGGRRGWLCNTVRSIWFSLSLSLSLFFLYFLMRGLQTDKPEKRHEGQRGRYLKSQNTSDGRPMPSIRAVVSSSHWMRFGEIRASPAKLPGDILRAGL